MIRDLFYFYKNALTRGLCGEYKTAWKQCKEDKRKLMDLALLQQSLPYVLTATFQNWGLSVDYLKEEFADYINGNYIGYDVDGVEGYTSSMWVDYHNDTTASEDVNVYIHCSGDITIEESKCPTIYVSNNSDINVLFDGYNSVQFYLFDESHIHFDYIPHNGTAIVFCYDERASVTVSENDGKIKIFQKELKL